MRVVNQVSIFLLLCIASGFAEHSDGSLPRVLPGLITRPSESCPSAGVQQSLLNQVESIISDIIADQPPCPCNIPGLWTRIAHLNMSDPNQVCPPSWRVNVTGSVRTCTRSTSGTDSAIFPANGRTYSRVCGRINAFQKGVPDAFVASTVRGANLEGPYVDGISLTHGEAGSRQHIWTFAAVRTERENVANFSCPCINTDSDVIHAVPGFVGTNYFCAAGHNEALGPTSINEVYLSDPLWDGAGCDSAFNTCCQFNSPPYFCTALPQPTTDDIEVRISHDEPSLDEDTLVSLIDIYVL